MEDQKQPRASNPQPTSAAIDRAAGDWFERRARGFTSGEAEAFARWLQADPRHAASLAELDETWKRLDGLRELGRERVLPKAASRRARRILFPLALASAAAIAFLLLRPETPPPMPFGGQQDETAVGGLKQITLADGSLVRLNTNSAIQVDYSTGERRVRLVRGEAHFEVEKDPARPFMVAVGGVAVRAVGTAFNVRVDGAAVEVLVSEGRVRIDDANRGASLLPSAGSPLAPVLSAGERAVVVTAQHPQAPAPAAVTVIGAAAMQRRLAWREGRLEFDGAPLSEVVNEFNRYNRHQLVIVDAALATRPFGGTIQLGDPDTLVRLLEARFGVVAERDDQRTLLRHGR